MGLFGGSRKSTTNQEITQIDNSIAAGEAARVNRLDGQGNIVNDAKYLTDTHKMNTSLTRGLFKDATKLIDGTNRRSLDFAKDANRQAMSFAKDANRQALQTAQSATDKTASALNSFSRQMSGFVTAQNPVAGNQKVLMAGVAAVGLVALVGVFRR